MQQWQQEDGWTTVNYQRSRKLQRFFTGPPRAQFHEKKRQPENGRSYASVTKMGISRGTSPQRYVREPGYKPQFFDCRLLSGAGQDNNNITTRNVQRQTYQKDFTGGKDDDGQTQTDTRIHKSEDPDFVQKVKGIHMVIKLAHHLNNVSASEPPPTIARLTNKLSTIIRPAFPNPNVQLLIEGNARNWAHTTLCILKDHYNDTMEMEMGKLEGLSPHDWRAPFEVAKSWARKNLGRRLKEDIFDRVEALLVARLDHRSLADDSRGTAGQPESPQYSQQTQPKVAAHSVHSVAQRRMDAHIQPQTSITKRTEVFRRPKIAPTSQEVTTSCMATMTDLQGDWSFTHPEIEEDNLIPNPSLSLKRVLSRTSFSKDHRPRRLSISHDNIRQPPPYSGGDNKSDHILNFSSEELKFVLKNLGETTQPTEQSLQLDKGLTPAGITRLEKAVQSHLDTSGPPQSSLISAPITPICGPTRLLNPTKRQWSSIRVMRTRSSRKLRDEGQRL